MRETIGLHPLPEKAKPPKGESVVPSNTLSRRSLLIGMATLPAGLGAAADEPAMTKMGNAKTSAAAARGLSHTSEMIRQEVTFDASPQRVYQALTTTKDFDSVTRLSDAAVLLAAAGAKPTAISTELGGPFTMFGGYIIGRHLEMLPAERLVQAWWAASWKTGEFSIAAFHLSAEGGKTRLKFEHRGFPNGQGPELAHGWYVHYWEPLAKFLAQGT
jgi:activator of HSP90 ATPase